MQENDIKLKLHPKQGVALLSEATEILFGGSAGGGKAISLKEEIPTANGWTTFGEVKEGDLVFTSTGTLTPIIAVSEIFYDHSCYEITFDNGQKIQCDEGHLWVTYTAKDLSALTRLNDKWREKRRLKRKKRGNGKRPDVAIKNSAKSYTYKLPPRGQTVTTQQIFETLKTKTGRTNHAIKLPTPLDLASKDLPLDPYLLGAWLGDGSKSSGMISGLDAEVWEQFEKAGFRVVHFDEKKILHSVYGLSSILRQLGVFANKHIPETYLRASKSQRLALLQGLMDTDGCCDKDGSVEFTNTNKKLAGAVYELVASLGWKVTINEGRATLYGKDCGPKYRVKFSPDAPVFRIKRKLERQIFKRRRTTNFHYIVDCKKIDPIPVRCVQVADPSGTFLVSRAMIPTHNSHLMRVAAILWCMEIPGLPVYLFRRQSVDLDKNHIEGSTGFRALLAPLTQSGFVEIVEGEIRFKNGENGTFDGGSRIFLCHSKNESDVILKYQGAEIGVLLIDEITQFTASMYRFLRSRVRISQVLMDRIPQKYWVAKDGGGERCLFPRIINSGNPIGAGVGWVKATFIDPRPELEIYKTEKEEGGFFRQYLPSRLTDNPSLDYDTYAATLQGLGSPELVEAMLHGNWNIIQGAFFSELGKIHRILPLDIPDHFVKFRSFDWGYSKPFSVGWWAVSDGTLQAQWTDGRQFTIPTGALIRYREWYGSTSPNEGLKYSTAKIAEGILARETVEERIAYGVADPSIWDASRGESIAETFLNNGVSWHRADNKRVNGWQQIRERLVYDADDPSSLPMLYVFDTCTDWWTIMPQQQHSLFQPEDIDTDGEDHLPDETRYGVMSRPFYRKKQKKFDARPRAGENNEVILYDTEKIPQHA